MARLRKPCDGIAACICAAMALVLLSGLAIGPARAQDGPDFATLARITAPGEIAPDRFQGQFVWLAVEETGHYRLSMAAPGALLLHVFPTEDGAPAEGVAPKLLRRDGTAFRAPDMDNLLLEAGRPYLLQAAWAVPQVVRLELITPLSAAIPVDMTDLQARSRETPVPLIPGQVLSLLPEASLALTVQAPGDQPLVLEAIAPPDGGPGVQLGQYAVGPGGLFPFRFADPARLDIRLSSQARADPAPLMLRITAMTALRDEREPNTQGEGGAPQDLGAAGPGGWTFAAHGMAPHDRDEMRFDLAAPGVFDLALDLDDGGGGTLTLEDDATDAPILRMTASDGRAWRQGLHLPAGGYRIKVETGDRPRPVGYSITLGPGTVLPDTDREPNDTPEFAIAVAPGTTLRGDLADEEPDHVRFDIAEPGKVWELRGIVGLRDLELWDGSGRQVGKWLAEDGALVVPLDLAPGPYLARLRGVGPYALRLSDIGARAPGFAHEPNDTDDTALTLRPGTGIDGAFHGGADRDLFLLSLTRPTPLTLRLSPPDDGAAVLRIRRDGLGWGQGIAAPDTGALTYTALFQEGTWAFELAPQVAGTSGVYRFEIAHAEGGAGPEPDHLSGRMQAMASDGDLAEWIGGVDADDLIFVPLADGGVTGLMHCQGGFNRAELRSFGDDQRLASFAPGEVVRIDDLASLGGAVLLKVSGQNVVADYDCRFRLPRGDEAALAPVDYPPEGLTLTTPAQVSGSFAEARDKAEIGIALPPGSFAAYRCGFEMAQEVDMTRQLRAAGNRTLADGLRAPALEHGHRVFVAGEEPARLTLQPPRDAPFPLGWRCDIQGEDFLATPAEIGPPAAFTAMRDRLPQGDGTAAYDPQAALALLAGGRPDWLQPAQRGGDLDVTAAIRGLEAPLRAYSANGQSREVTIELRNDGGEAADVSIALRPLADGWRIAGDLAARRLAVGEGVAIPLTLQVPPMQSPLADPALELLLATETAEAARIFPVPLAFEAEESTPARFWSIPAPLRGAFDPLAHQLGARLIALDGAPVDDATALKHGFLHDGVALHSDIPGQLAARSLTFALASPASVTGLRLHLRSTAAREHWPDRVALELSADGDTFLPVLDERPTGSEQPQVFALPRAVDASHARLRLFGCQGSAACPRIALADVGLTAGPDWAPPAPINIADPLHGGHVIAAWTEGGSERQERPFREGWNAGLLVQGQSGPVERAAPKRGDRIVAILGFHKNRAALIDRVEWQGAADDPARIAPIPVQASAAGATGPWTPIGTLEPPPEGAASSVLSLDAPVWARALRLELRRDAEENRAGPDRIAVFEAEGAPSVLGLWEDDLPQAGYEAVERPEPLPAPDPAGGADAGQAVPLVPGATVASSVQIERNEDWWQITVPDGPPQELSLDFTGQTRPEIAWSLRDAEGAEIPLARRADARGLTLTALLAPGAYRLRVYEPPRSIVISWDTSGSVGAYIPRTLSAVRVWSNALLPGRDALQLLPFGQTEFLLPDWAERPEDVYPVLASLPQTPSSDAETAMGLAAAALADRTGARGIVIITDAETSQGQQVWGPLLVAAPRVVALSIHSSDSKSVEIMKDWATLNGGLFHRVTSHVGLSDGLDMAAALFRGPKGYRMAVSLTEAREPEGTGALIITAPPEAEAPAPTGGLEVILDASGSMLQRMPDGTRRIAVAHEALSSLVRDVVPAGTPFAFRAFGLEADACRSELVLPLAPLDPGAAERAIRDVPAINLAKTAIADSLRLAAEDLSALDPPRVVVLVTDGDETCEGDVAGTIDAIRASGIDLHLNIIGFAIDDAALAQSFADWADRAGGRYLQAGDADGLIAAVTEATEPRFALTRLYLDGREEAAGFAKLGAEMPLPAGRYRLSPAQTAGGAPILVEITDTNLTAVTFDADGLRPAPPR